MTLHSALARSADDLVIPIGISDDKIFQPKPSISKESVLEDIEALIAALKNGYGGWRELAGQLEGETFPRLREFSSAGASTKDVCEFIGRVLDPVRDHHLAVNEFGSEKQCGKTLVKLGSVGPNIDREKRLAWAYFEKTIRGKTVPVISINRLPPPGKAWEGFQEKIGELAASAPALILDVRGVHGGDDEVTHEMARTLFGITNREVSLAPASTVIQRQTPEALALFLNTLGMAIIRQRFSGNPCEQLSGYYRDYQDLLSRAQAKALPLEDITVINPSPIDSARVFRGPIRILVDSECASGCESVIEFFERHPNAKTVGECSAGLVHFGQMGTLWLRNSNVFVSIATRSYSFADGRFVEKTGYPPAIRVQPGHDALHVAIDDIERGF